MMSSRASLHVTVAVLNTPHVCIHNNFYCKRFQEAVNGNASISKMNYQTKLIKPGLADHPLTFKPREFVLERSRSGVVVNRSKLHHGLRHGLHHGLHHVDLPCRMLGDPRRGRALIESSTVDTPKIGDTRAIVLNRAQLQPQLVAVRGLTP